MPEFVTKKILADREEAAAVLGRPLARFYLDLFANRKKSARYASEDTSTKRRGFSLQGSSGIW